MATIDPPAADVAAKARERRDAAKERLAKNKSKRSDVQSKLESAASDNKSALNTASGDASGVPAS